MFKIDHFVSMSAIKSVSSINADDKICLHIPLTLSVQYWIYSHDLICQIYATGK